MDISTHLSLPEQSFPLIKLIVTQSLAHLQSQHLQLPGASFKHKLSPSPHHHIHPWPVICVLTKPLMALMFLHSMFLCYAVCWNPQNLYSPWKPPRMRSLVKLPPTLPQRVSYCRYSTLTSVRHEHISCAIGWWVSPGSSSFLITEEAPISLLPPQSSFINMPATPPFRLSHVFVSNITCAPWGDSQCSSLTLCCKCDLTWLSVH